MKTIAFCRTMNAFFSPCGEEAALGSTKENVWKKTIDTRQDSLDADRQQTDDAISSPIDRGIGNLLITGSAYNAKRLIRSRQLKAD